MYIAIDTDYYKLLLRQVCCTCVHLGSQGAAVARRVFQHYFAQVSEAIQNSTNKIAREFHTSKLISLEVMNDVLTNPRLSSTQKSSTLMLAIGKVIEMAKNEKPFESFCQVMKFFRELESLASKMTERFGRFIVWCM